jgi:uncharacterized membrane protein SirB2
MPEYAFLKAAHVACVAASYLFFFVRGVWMIRRSPLLQRGWVRVLPHVVDTLLLASAVALAVMLAQYPFAHAWLTAKVTGLVLYIALGMVALKLGATLRARIAAWLAAQAVFAYVVAVAITKNPFLIH